MLHKTNDATKSLQSYGFEKSYAQNQVIGMELNAYKIDTPIQMPWLI